jgi:hypothetical protein
MIRQWAYLSICLPALLLGQIPGVRGPEYEITGQVLDAQTQEPVARATVTAMIGGSFPQSQLTILTDSAGPSAFGTYPPAAVNCGASGQDTSAEVLPS